MFLPGDAAMAFLASLAACVVAGRFAIPLLRRAQWVAPVRYEDCPPLMEYQEAKQKTPTMGGLFLLAAAVAAAAASGGLAHRNGWVVLGTVLAFGLVGVVDDVLKFRGTNAIGLRSVPKLSAALAIGAVIGLMTMSGPHSSSAVEIPWANRSVELGWAWVPFAMLVISGCAHAVNLTDGMDGLAAGCAAIVFIVLGVWAMVGEPHQQALAPWCIALAGACVGFLWFNSFPASVFMGDVGALGLGGAMGAISLLTRTSAWLAIIGGVFVLEALSVMLQVASYKWRGKQRIFRVAPIHHHFHLGGVSEPKVIVRFWIVGLMLGLVGLATAGGR